MSYWIAERTEHLSFDVPPMQLSEFMDCCQKAGCEVRSAGTNWLIRNNGVGSISIAQKTPKLSGPVVRRYLRKLGLTLSASGISGTEFTLGIGEERDQVRRYMIAMRRLAKT